jgi:hypothetical protein
MEKKPRSTLLNPKIKKTVLMLIAVTLIFAGPTYVVYVLQLKIEYTISIIFGFILLLIGFVLLIYLVSKGERLKQTNP